jgi:hypothetical protein
LNYKLITNWLWMKHETMNGNPCEWTPFMMWSFRILASMTIRMGNFIPTNKFHNEHNKWSKLPIISRGIQHKRCVYSMCLQNIIFQYLVNIKIHNETMFLHFLNMKIMKKHMIIQSPHQPKIYWPLVILKSSFNHHYIAPW